MDKVCNICNSKIFKHNYKVKDYEYKVSGVWTYDYCYSCDIYQIDPFPKCLREVENFYPRGYGKYKKSNLFNILNNRMLRMRLSGLNLSKDNFLNVMDIGAGDCRLIEFLVANYKISTAVAIDISFQVNEMEKNYLKINNVFQKTNFKKESFDFISMINYLEHTLNPQAELDKAYSYLKPGAVFYGVLPNWDSFDRLIFGKYWGGMHIPRHLYQFTPNSLRKILLNSGFTDVVIRNEIHPGHLSISISNLIVDLFNINKVRIPFFALLTILLFPISIFFTLFNKNGSMTFKCKR